MRRCIPILLSWLAGLFFRAALISGLQIVNFGPVRRNRRIKSRQKARLVASLLTGLCLGAFATHAQDATWVGGGGGPQFGQWNAHQNWGHPGNSIPTGTAIFQDHTPTSVTISLTDQHPNPPTNIGTIQFNAGALAYSFTNNTTFNVTSSGIVNNSASQQTFINNSLLNFLNSSTAGDTLPSTIIHTTNGGLTSFFGSSTGGLARFITDSGGSVDISTLTSAGMTSGSIEGAGIYSLGSKQLTTGLNNISTVVSGVIADGGAAGGTGGSLIKVGTGTLTLSGANTYTGNTAVNGGTLLVNGSLGPGSVNVSSRAALGGTGAIGGPVTIQNGGILTPGVSSVPGTLTMGSLTLNSGSILNYKYGIPNVVNMGINDLVNVMGNLTLAGTLNVTNVGGFGAGAYRVFNYTGSLTNNTLNLGSLPSGFNFSVDTAHANQVNLVVSGSLPTQFWDGSNTTPGNVVFGRGGDGTWNNITTNTNWTTQGGTQNAAWGNGFAVFAGTAGTVTLGDNIHFTGMQFLTDGYLIQTPGSLTLLAAPNTTILADVGITATISAPIADDSGPAKLTKSEAGTLILTGNNTYTGGTTINGGTLQLGNGGTGGSVVGNIVDNASLVFNRSDAVTYDGIVSGSGSLAQSGTGVLTLLGTNTYTGGTFLNAGIIAVGSDQALGAPENGALTFNGGTLRFDAMFDLSPARPITLLSGGGTINTQSFTTTISQGITGSGSLTKTGTGTLVLTANNSYTGGTTIAAGTLQLGNGGTSGSIVGNATDNGALVFKRSDTVTFPGLISGIGSVIQAGTGTTILTADNSYTGGTTISAGTLQLGNAGTTGSIVGSVTDNGALAFNRSDTVTFPGFISGIGSVIQAGTGTTILTADNSYTGGTTISAGTLQLGNAGTTGSIVGSVTDNGALAFNRSDTVTFPGFISGIGSVIQAGTGTTILTADNSYTGGTTISVGTLQFGNGGTTGSIVGNVTDNGALAFNRSDTVTFPGLISGIGSVVQAGTGTAILTADNSYTGGTTISAGTLQLGNGGTTGSIAGNVIDNGALIFNRSNTLTFAGVISGTGTVQQNGTGTTVLVSDNTYTGTTTVNAGSLIVDGSIASAQTLVNPGGLLGGNGIIGKPIPGVSGIGSLGGSLVNSGTVSPGNSPGTLTVSGNYTQNPNGTLRIEIGGLAANQHDLLAVGAHASLNGTLQLMPLGSFQLHVGDKVTFLTANGGVSGNFSTIQNQFGTIVKTQIVILPTSVLLEGTQGSFVPAACNPNTVAVAQALDSAVGNPRAAALIDFLDSQPINNLCGDFQLIAPEQLTSIFNIGVSLANVQSANLERRMEDIRAGSTGFNSAGFIMNGIAPSYSGGLSGPTGPEGKSGLSVLAPTPENRWGVFATGLGEFTHVDSTDAARGFDLQTGGVTFGVDYRIGSNFGIGLIAGYAQTNADVANGGDIDVNSGKFGLYATAFSGGFYLDSALTGGVSGYDTRRIGLDGTASGSTNGGDLNVLVSGGYDWKKGGLSLGPTASFQYTYVSFDGFTESGSLAPLKFNDQHVDSIRTAFGAKASHDWKVGPLLIRPELRAAWQHEYGNSAYSIIARFADGAGSSFTATSPRIGRDSLLLDAGVGVSWTDRFSTYIYYDGELGRTNYQSNNVSAGVRVTF